MDGDLPQVPVAQKVRSGTSNVSQTFTERIKIFIKIPRILVPLLIYLILLGPTFYLYSGSPPETEVEVYKGAWFTVMLPSHFSEMEEMGFNTFFTRGDSGEGTISLIQAAHRNGLKVALTTDFEGPYLKKIDKHSQYWTLHIIETAKMAEKYGVEFFAPLAEPEGVFGKDTSRWAQEILPKIKEVYSGEIIWRGGDLVDMDFSGYDYITFCTYMDASATSEEYSQHIDSELDRALGFCQRDDCKGVMIADFGSWQNHDPGDVLSGIFEIIINEGKHTALGKEDVTEAYDTVFERGKDKAVGYFFFNEYPGVSSKWKEVVEQWYKEIL